MTTVPLHKLPHYELRTGERVLSTSDDPQVENARDILRGPLALYPFMFDAHSTLPLVDGWKVDFLKHSGDCLSADLVMRNTFTGATETFTVLKDRGDSMFSRQLACSFSGGAAVYAAALLNARYLAFDTSEPGWVFFDREQGKFLATVLSSEGYGSSDLHVDESGKVLATGTDGHSPAPRGFSGWREVVLQGHSLQAAPLVNEELASIPVLNQRQGCIQRPSRPSCLLPSPGRDGATRIKRWGFPAKTPGAGPAAEAATPVR